MFDFHLNPKFYFALESDVRQQETYTSLESRRKLAQIMSFLPEADNRYLITVNGYWKIVIAKNAKSKLNL